MARTRPPRVQTDPMANSPSSDEQKDKFKAALEAKKAKGGHSGTGAQASGGAGKGHSSREGGKREFRRKSGG